ncbi:MAG TPA: two-component system response regulator [Elusimicrobia bacterium]|nr:two-component system response regulator [Elusimicrobiota bacterium]
MALFGSKDERPTILIAEDDMVLRSVVGSILEAEGYRILEAANGQEAVEMARAEPPAIIILDIQMPLMNGIQATAALRADPKTAAIPILICSAHGTFDNVEQCLALGAKDFIIKPFDTARLRDKVKAVLAKGKETK